MTRRLWTLRFYLFDDRGVATTLVAGVDGAPGAARIPSDKLWRELEAGEEVRFGDASYRVGAVALEHCSPTDEAGRLVRSGAWWLGGGTSLPLSPPSLPRPGSEVYRRLGGNRRSGGSGADPGRISR